MRLPLIACALLILPACDNGRWAPGYLITSNGETLSNTDENKRALTIQTINTQLDQQLGGNWRCETTINELPVYHKNSARGESDWMWPKATVSVVLIGDGAGESALTDDQVTTAIRNYLYHQVEKPHRNLHITIARVVDVTRFTSTSQPATVESSALTTKPAPFSAKAQSYTVQAGDTWADLSQAFYGTAQHWRHIAEANQHVELTPGREIVIPIKP
jgi:LysM repeat protein